MNAEVAVILWLLACTGAEPAKDTPPSEVTGPVWLGPAAPRLEGACNGVDDDGDGAVDEDAVGPWWFPDADGDGYAGTDGAVQQCIAPPGSQASPTDCDDADAAVNPGAEEVCDLAEIDEDCNGVGNEDDAVGCVPLDRDGDGWYPLEDDGGRCLCDPDGIPGDCDDTTANLTGDCTPGPVVATDDDAYLTVVAGTNAAIKGVGGEMGLVRLPGDGGAALLVYGTQDSSDTTWVVPVSPGDWTTDDAAYTLVGIGHAAVEDLDDDGALDAAGFVIVALGGGYDDWGNTVTVEGWWGLEEGTTTAGDPDWTSESAGDLSFVEVSTIHAYPAADTDADGDLDIRYGHRLSAFGDVRPGWVDIADGAEQVLATTAAAERRGSPFVGDLDGDGLDDFAGDAAAPPDAGIWLGPGALEAEPDLVVPAWSDAGYVAPVGGGDLDGDGCGDVAMSLGSSVLVYFCPTGNPTADAGWEVTEVLEVSERAIGDADAEGGMDLLVYGRASDGAGFVGVYTSPRSGVWPALYADARFETELREGGDLPSVTALDGNVVVWDDSNETVRLFVWP